MPSAENSDSGSPKQQRLPKFKRQPRAVADKKLTTRSFQIILAISRYRFLPTSLVVRLVEGNEDVTHRHLQQLFHKGLINRFAFPKLGSIGEFNYYLDHTAALDLLVEHGLAEKGDLDREGVRRNRDKAYHRIHEEAEDSAGRLLFLQHEVMISRFHFMLEMGCNQSKGRVVLTAWKQGPELHQSVTDPEIGELLPHRPDAFFTLHFPEDPDSHNKANFFYEADRKTTSIPKMLAKFRAHVEFIRQGKHRERYGIRRVRAVLVETLDIQWAEELRQASAKICSVPLFWFTSSEIIRALHLRGETGGLRDQLPAKKIWASNVGDALFSLDSPAIGQPDIEN